jgi:hypothetical protein
MYQPHIDKDGGGSDEEQSANIAPYGRSDAYAVAAKNGP